MIIGVNTVIIKSQSNVEMAIGNYQRIVDERGSNILIQTNLDLKLNQQIGLTIDCQKLARALLGEQAVNIQVGKLNVEDNRESVKETEYLQREQVNSEPIPNYYSPYISLQLLTISQIL